MSISTLPTRTGFSATLKIYLLDGIVTSRGNDIYELKVEDALRAILGDRDLEVLSGTISVGQAQEATRGQRGYVPVRMQANFVSMRRGEASDVFRAMARAYHQSTTTTDAAHLAYGPVDLDITQGADIVTAWQRSDKTFRNVRVDPSSVYFQADDLTAPRPAPVPAAAVAPPAEQTPSTRVVDVDLPAHPATASSPAVPARVARIATRAPSGHSAPATSTVTVRDRATGAVVEPTRPTSTPTSVTTAPDGTITTELVAETARSTVRATTAERPGAPLTVVRATTQAKPAWDPSDPGAVIQPGSKGTINLLPIAVGVGAVVVVGLLAMKYGHRVRPGRVQLPRGA